MSGSGSPICQKPFRKCWVTLPICFARSFAWPELSFPQMSSAKLRGGIWLALAGIFGLASLALVLGALVAWITSLDVSLHVAFLIVAAGVGLLAVIAYFAGQKDAQAELTPSRTISQVKRDIEITKEQLT